MPPRSGTIIVHPCYAQAERHYWELRSVVSCGLSFSAARPPGGVGASVCRRATVRAFAEDRLDASEQAETHADARQNWYQRGAASLRDLAWMLYA